MLTKAERADRWKKCQEHLRRAGSIPEAQKLGKKDGFSAPTSAWITALGKSLEGR